MKWVALLCLLLIFSGIMITQSQPAEATSCSPESCTVDFPLNCKNYATTNESIKLLLVNRIDRNVTIRNITAQSKAFSPVNGTDSNHNCSLAFAERDKLLEPDEGRVYTLDVSTEPGSKCSYYDIRYKNIYNLEIYYGAGSPRITHRTVGWFVTSNPKDFSPDPLFPAFSDYAPPLFLGLSLILLVAAVVCFVKKKTVLALVLMALFAISLFLAALAYLGMFDPICY